MMSKDEILEYFNVSNLSEIKDEDLIKLAKYGKLGRRNMWAVASSWMFSSETELAGYLREAIELGKQVHCAFYNGEGLVPSMKEVWLE